MARRQPPMLFALGIIHKAMMAGQVFFAGICIFLISTGRFDAGLKEMDRNFQVIALVVSAAAFWGGTAFFKKQLLVARDSSGDAAEKFSFYRKGSIVQWALMEGAALLNIIGFFLTANYAFIILAGVLILLFAMMAPSKGKVQLQLGLDEEEINSL